MNKIFVGKILRLIPLFAGLFCCSQLEAHEVYWPGNFSGFLTNSPLTIYSALTNGGEV